MVVVNVLFLFLIGFNVIRIYEEPSGGGRENVSMILQAIVVFFHDKMALLAVVSQFVSQLNIITNFSLLLPLPTSLCSS